MKSSRIQRRLLRSWIIAAEDLGIEAEQYGDFVVVRQFGTPEGTLCSPIHGWRGESPWSALESEAKRLGMSWSGLGKPYLSYNRETFIEALNDWGWCGTGDPPPWYAGQSAEPSAFDR